MVKVPKAASSTAAGVALCIHNHTGCEVQWKHRYPNPYGDLTHTSQSFLFASIRNPASRDLTHMQFFILPTIKTTPKAEHFIEYRIKSGDHHSLELQNGQGGFQYRWLSTEPIPNGMMWSKLVLNSDKDRNCSSARKQPEQPLPLSVPSSNPNSCIASSKKCFKPTTV
jgi:hypothetical protein